MTQEIRRLPDAELEVMQAVWDCEVPAERSAIQERLKDTHPVAPTTLLTVLGRLAEKGFLEIDKTHRSARNSFSSSRVNPPSHNAEAKAGRLPPQSLSKKRRL